MLAVLCPGQGSQSAGFLRPWLDADGVSGALASLSTAAGMDLVRLGTDPAADVVDTAVAQPLIVTAGVATAAGLGALPTGTVLLGHSIGELTAAAVAGLVSAETAVQLAAARGRAMATAAAATPSGMVAVLGGDADEVAAAIERAGGWIANVNGAGQVVAAGSATAMAGLLAAPPPGARMRPLPVAGAFHTPLMQTARDQLAALVGSVEPRSASRQVVANADGALVDDTAEFLTRLVAQVTAPVRFDRCLDTLQRLGVTSTIELAPGGVLTGLVRRALPGVTAVALRTPDDLAAAHELIGNELATAGEQWDEGWSVLVAPATGTLQLATDATEPVVRNRTGDVPVQVAGAVQVLEWLAHDGDPVREGQPLARVLAVSG